MAAKIPIPIRRRQASAAGLGCVLLLASAARAEVVDRVVAVVGDRAVAWSAVYEEARYQALLRGQPAPQWSASGPLPADANTVLEKLIDQLLIEQALSRSPFALSGSEDTSARANEIVQRYASPEAYDAALKQSGFTQERLRGRLAREDLLLAFIDATLRPQVRLTEAQVEDYYREVLAPELQRTRSAEAMPPLEDVRPEIEEILTQRQIDLLLEGWLSQMRRSTQIELRLAERAP